MVFCDGEQYSVPAHLLDYSGLAAVHGRVAAEQASVVHVGPTGPLQASANGEPYRAARSAGPMVSCAPVSALPWVVMSSLARHRDSSVDAVANWGHGTGVAGDLLRCGTY
jgi:hypothetical protein